jgi:endonuclease YncB( thermonuclease family)
MMLRLVKTSLLFSLLLLTSGLARAGTISGTVVGIVSGDTITLRLRDRSQKPIRLLGVQAPETNHCFASISRQHLSDLISGKNVTVEYSSTASSEVLLGRVVRGSTDVALEMLSKGLVGYYKEHEQLLSKGDTERYLAAASAAKLEKRDLCEPAPQLGPQAVANVVSPPKRPATSIPSLISVVFYGRVVEITGGASVSLVKEDSSRVEICLRDLDVPEPGQPYSDVAKQHLGDLILGRTVAVRFRGLYEDSDCLMGDVYLEGTNVVLQMVRDGVAWYNENTAYPEGSLVYQQSEQAARSEGRGIWQDPHPVPPWVFRDTYGDSSGGYYASGGYYGSSGPARQAGTDVHVRGYYRRDGTYVRAYTRSAPGRGAGRGGPSGGRSGYGGGRRR